MIQDFTLPLGGKPYRFEWGIRQLMGMQESLITPREMPSLESIQAHLLAGRVKYVIEMIRFGLQRYHPSLTDSDVIDIVEAASVDEIRAVLMKFMFSSTPDQKDVEALPKPKRTNPRKAQTKKTDGASSISALAASA